MTPPILSELAQEDLDGIWDSLALVNLSAADRFLDDLWQQAELHARFRGLGRSRDELGKNLRSFVVGRYVVFFQVDANIIHIVRVLHGARDLDAEFSAN